MKRFILMLCLAALHSIHADRTRFVVVIPSYNNAQFCEWNLRSVLDQKYKHFKVIYVNDASNDKTEECVRNVIRKHLRGHLVRLVNNRKNLGALENIYRSVYNFTSSEEVVVLLDGDDAFAHPNVLKRLDKVYSSSDIWLTYGQFIERHSRNRGFARPIPYQIAKEGKVRAFPHVPSHLRTFKSWLFKRIRVQDLKKDGRFYAMSWDLAIMLPCIEMAAHEHYRYIDEVLYIYNDCNPISDHQKSRSLQFEMDHEIRARQRYHPLGGK